jgi:hypothetical protein
MNQDCRPDVGPHLYITPPGSFTKFHRDGGGTVDSGHLCLEGYNEVVMLRRIPHCHSNKALELLRVATLKVLPHNRPGVRAFTNESRFTKGWTIFD